MTPDDLKEAWRRSYSASFAASEAAKAAGVQPDGDGWYVTPETTAARKAANLAWLAFASAAMGRQVRPTSKSACSPAGQLLKDMAAAWGRSVLAWGEERRRTDVPAPSVQREMRRRLFHPAFGRGPTPVPEMFLEVPF